MLTMAERVKQQRKINKITQEELAEKVSCSVMTIKRIENRKETYTPNSSLLLRIAKALNTSVGYLMGSEETKLASVPIDVAKTKSIQEDKGNVKYIMNNGEVLEIPATPAGFDFFEKLLNKGLLINTPIINTVAVSAN